LFTEKAIGALGRGSTYKENMIQCIGNFKKLAAEVVEEAASAIMPDNTT
jgi:hypothetical protein